MKIRKLTTEECKSVITKQYDTGFSLWIKQPGMKGERCILDASLLLEKGTINLHPPIKHPNGDFKYGSIIGKNNNEIMIVALD